MRIELFSEASQIKQLLLEAYGDNYLDIITNEYDPLCTSIPQYLKGNVLKNVKFKKFLCRHFNKPYEELVKPYFIQVEESLIMARENIGSKSLVIDIDSIYRACISHKQALLGDMCLAFKAVRAFATGDRKQAFLLFKSNESKIMTNEGLMINESEYAFASVLIGDHEKAQDLLSHIDIESAEHNFTKYIFFFASGFHYQSDYNKRLTKAKTAFARAAEHGPTNQFKAQCYNNLSQVYRDKEEYSKAIKYQMLAYDKYGDKEESIGSLNNIAQVYLRTGQIEKAQKYINLAFSQISKVKNTSRLYAIMYTYLKVYGSDKITPVLDLIDGSNLYTFKSYVTDLFELMIELSESEEMTKVIESKIVILYISSEDEEVKLLLKASLGAIALKRLYMK